MWGGGGGGRGAGGGVGAGDKSGKEALERASSGLFKLFPKAGPGACVSVGSSCLPEPPLRSEEGPGR